MMQDGGEQSGASGAAADATNPFLMSPELPRSTSAAPPTFTPVSLPSPFTPVSLGGDGGGPGGGGRGGGGLDGGGLGGGGIGDGGIVGGGGGLGDGPPNVTGPASAGASKMPPLWPVVASVAPAAAAAASAGAALFSGGMRSDGKAPASFRKLLSKG